MQSVSSNAVARALNGLIKYKEVRTNAITINQGGWTDISSYMPSGMNNFLFALMYNFGTVSNGTAITISSNGLYASGSEYATVNYLVIRYYYTD